jgi:hypothetical protein
MSAGRIVDVAAVCDYLDSVRGSRRSGEESAAVTDESRKGNIGPRRREVVAYAADMPKSRGHKKTKKQTFREEVLPLNERARQALMWQLEQLRCIQSIAPLWAVTL